MNKLLQILLCFMLALNVYAGPVDPDIEKRITLQNGKEITVRMVGDEYFSYFKDVNSDRCYIKDSVSSQYIPLDLSAHSRRYARATEMRQQANAKRIAMRPYYKCEGNRKMLTVLIEFPDKAFDRNNVALFDRIFNEKKFTYGRHKGSVKDYFTDQSNGKFIPSFDIVGPIKMSHFSYYYGSNEGGLDKKSREIFLEIYSQLKNKVDFSKYDWDGDGTAEPINIIFAGYAEELGGTENDIWCHASNLTDEEMEKCDNKLYRFTLVSELRNVSGSPLANGIGTICHEMSHTLGLPDTYDGNDKFYGGRKWDIMGNGVHNDNGFTPAGYTSLDKMMMGWQLPIELKGSQEVKYMEPLSAGGDFYRITNDAFPSEFYLIENRQNYGVWDSGLPSSGVLIWHVDYSNFTFTNNNVNNSKDSSHEHFALFLADNNRESNTYSSDTYPYSNNNSLTNTSQPSATLWHANVNGKYLMDKPITNIHCNSNGIASFTFTNNIGTVPPAKQPTDVKCEETGYLANCFFDLDIKELNLSGTVNTRDMQFANTELTQLEELNLKNCEIIDHNGKSGSLDAYHWFSESSAHTIHLPRLQEMGKWIFGRNENLQRIYMQDGLTTLPYCTFYRCNNLQEVTLPQTLTAIDEYVFTDCVQLSHVDIPTSVTTIGNYAFAGCSSLTSIDIPSSVTNLGFFAFNNCSKLTSANIQAKVTTIKKTTFYNCTSLTTLTLPETLEVVDSFAFRNCNIQTLTLPEHVKELKYCAFWDNKNMKQVVSKSLIPPTCGDFPFSNEAYSNATLLVPRESLSAYKTADIWKKFKKIESIEENTSIDSPSMADPPLYVEGTTIHLNSSVSAQVQVFTLSGIRVSPSIINENTIQVPQPGVYIVRLNGKSITCMCRN